MHIWSTVDKVKLFSRSGIGHQMGSCVCKESSDGESRTGSVVEEMVKVVTSTGRVMELYAPITAACITDEFPGYALFPTSHSITSPLPGDHRLRPGGYYYLLPLHHHRHEKKNLRYNKFKSVTESSNPSSSSSSIRVQLMRKASEATVDKLPRRSSTVAGEVWKVRLVISSDELSQILAHEARTQALIDSVRAVAKFSAVATPTVDHRFYTFGPVAY